MNYLIALLALVAAAPQEEAFQTANQAYEARQYEIAATQYESIIAGGVIDPTVFYNLGNAYFRLGQVPPAIANYERALQLDPRHANAQANLKYALAATERNLAKPLRQNWQESLLFWDDSLRYGEARFLALVCWVTFWCLLLARVLMRRRWQFPVIILLALAAVAFMASMYSKAYPLPLAVANREEVQVRTGANPADTVRFALKPGDRVRVETESNGWLRVATVDGERGWAPADAFVLVGPPYTAPPGVAPASGDNTP